MAGGLSRWLTLVAPFADEVEAALEERVVVGRRGSSEGEDGGGEGRGGFGGLVFGVGFGWSGGTEVRMRWLGRRAARRSWWGR